jgi:chromodomain-helicase-DNA-binding protein 1
MPIELWLSHNNLAFRICQGPNFRDEKERLKFVLNKTPIYKLDTFDHWEIPKANYSKLKEVYADRILVKPEAQDFIKYYQIQTARLKDLPKERLEVQSLDGKILKPYQEDWVCTYSKRKGLAIFLDTGTGKTLGSCLRSANLGFEQLLVVCGAQNIADWKENLRAILGLTDCLIYTGEIPKKKRNELNLESPKVIICNYEMLKELEGKLSKKLDSIIVDEAHNVSTGNQAGKALYRIVRKAQKLTDASVQVMTATPKEDSLEELWTLVNLVNPELAGDKKEFLNKYQEVTRYQLIKLPNGREWRQPAGFKTKNEAELRDFISRAGYRVNKEFYIKFEDISRIVPVDMTAKQAEVYNEIREDLLILSQDKTFYLENPLVRLGKSLEAAEGAYNIYPDMIESGKLNYAEKEVIPSLQRSGKKGIMFFRYVLGSEIVHSWIPNSSVLINGSVPNDLKLLSRMAFQGAKSDVERDGYKRLLEKYPEFPHKNPGDAQILIATYSKRSGAGHNYPDADSMWIFSYDWSATSLSQAIGRNKRLDSNFTKSYTNYIISAKTVETEAVPQIIKKIKENSDMLDGVGSSQSLRAREIMSMIRKVRWKLHFY